jgi:hypothetical protein
MLFICKTVLKKKKVLNLFGKTIIPKVLRDYGVEYPFEDKNTKNG